MKIYVKTECLKCRDGIIYCSCSECDLLPDKAKGQEKCPCNGYKFVEKWIDLNEFCQQLQVTGGLKVRTAEEDDEDY